MKRLSELWDYMSPDRIFKNLETASELKPKLNELAARTIGKEVGGRLYTPRESGLTRENAQQDGHDQVQSDIMEIEHKYQEFHRRFSSDAIAGISLWSSLIGLISALFDTQEIIRCICSWAWGHPKLAVFLTSVFALAVRWWKANRNP